jgi:phosphatidylinositol alpha-1,6-mannosyltransferase
MKNIIMVSAGLSISGGGSAHLGRIITQVSRSYCDEHNLNFQIFHLGHPTDVVSGVKIQHFNTNQLNLALSLWKTQLQHPDSVVIFDHLGPARTQALLPMKLRQPYLLFLLGIEVWRSFSWDKRKALMNASIRLAISTYTLQRMRQFAPWLGTTDILYLALEERTPSGVIDHDLLSRVGSGYLLIVGRLARGRHKGHDEVLSILPELLARHPHIKLVIAGTGDDRDRLETLVAKYNVQNNVIFTGFVSETTLAELYDRCAIFVMPSREEGFGLVYLEAMRAKKPCVVLRDAAAAEIIVDKVTGLQVNDNKPEELLSAIECLLEDQQFASMLGENGFRRWREEFSYQVFRTKMQTYLSHLLSL